MSKKFNILIYYASYLLYLLDSELCFKFNDGRNRDSGLPIELEQLTMEKHYEVLERIRSFKFQIRNNEKATLKLNSEDLNHLGIHGYKDYSQQTEKYKAWEHISYYEIRNNVLIGKKIYNLYFFKRKMWHNEVCIHFWVEDGMIKQKKKIIYKLNQEYDSEEYKEVSRFRQSNLINLIFLPNYLINRSSREPDQETANIIKKIKSIDVIDNRLVITG